jgi:hypothetical protein
MKTLIITFLALLPCLSFAGPLSATLQKHPDKAGAYTITITNSSDKVVRIADVAEGTAMCSTFWEVTIRKGEKVHRSGENSLYAPAGVPTVVEIQPGKTVSRMIQPAAYVFRAEHLSEPYSLTVTYRILDKKRERLAKLVPEADLTLTFSTPEMEIVKSNKKMNRTQ